MSHTPEGFIEFIKAQPEDKPITHGSWGNCAVGAYVGREDANLFANHTLRHEYPRLWDMLNKQGYGEMDTYGDLQQWLINRDIS